MRPLLFGPLRQPYTEPGWLDTWMGQIELYAGHGWPPARIAAFLEPSVNEYYWKRGAKSAYLTADEVIEARAEARGIMVPARIAPGLERIAAAVSRERAAARMAARATTRRLGRSEWAPGGRNHRIWQAYREGRTYADVAAEFGLSISRVRGIVFLQQETEDARIRAARRCWAASRRDLGRPLDMGGPRDVWLTYLPSFDPRFDNMVPVV